MKEQDYNLFEDYLGGSLTENEIKAFEKKLHDDKQFLESFSTYKELSVFLNNQFQDQEDLKFENNLKNISDKYFQKKEEKSTILRFRPWQYAIAASIVVFFGLIFLNKLSEPNYSDYANYENVNFTVRGENDELLAKAEKTFNNKDFSEAIKYFNQILESDQGNAEIQLYKAISLIEVNQFNEADEILGSLSQKPTVYKYKAVWYWALSKLKQNDDEECENILKQIPKEADEYQKANKLIRKL